MPRLHQLRIGQSGATTIEYAAICLVIVLVVLVGIVTLGNSVAGRYNNVADQVVPVL